MRAAVALAALLLCAPARAEPPLSDVEIALRAGYGLPFGKVTADEPKLSDTISGMLALGIEGFYRFTPNLLGGVYLSYGFLSSSCAGCEGHELRLGLQGAFHFLPRARFDPWVSLGFGYEALSYATSLHALDGRGWEIANLQVGGDLRLAESFTIGPFVSFSLDVTTKIDGTMNGFPMTFSDFDKSLHEWLVFGVRARLDI